MHQFLRNVNNKIFDVDKVIFKEFKWFKELPLKIE
jgi:hypothetical protein